MSVLDVEAAPLTPAKPAASNRARRGIRIIEAKSTALSTFLIVLLLTAIAGILRFAWIDKPTLWGDDALTYMKVAGSFPDMLRELRRQGFGPLHYELYWWMRQQTVLTPFMMRLVPSICGTLMVPAMYFLAIQLVNRRAALIATLFTAVSAYMLNYARDAKMYAELWFFATLSMACLLWWLRARTPLSWLCWIAATTAMVGIQLLGFAVVGIELLIVLTAPRQNWSGYFFLPVTLIWLAALTVVAFFSFPVACVLGVVYLAMLAFRRVRSRYSPTPIAPGRTVHLDVLTSVLWPARWTAIGAGILLFVAYRQSPLFPLTHLPLSIWNAVTAEYASPTHNPLSSWIAIAVLAAALALISFLIHDVRRKIAVLIGVVIVLICAMRIGSTTALVVLGASTLIYGIFSWAIGYDWLAEGFRFAPRYSAARANSFLYGCARRVTWPAILLFAIGTGISSFPVIYSYAFNTDVNSFVENAVEDGQPDGLAWIPPYNRGRKGLDYFQYTATAWLYKWEWPKDYPALGIRDIDEVDPGTRRLLVASAYAFVCIAFLSLLPWSRRLTHDSESPTAVAGRTWWRRTLWVSAWLVALPYGLYAQCMPRTESPVEWFFRLTQTTDAPALTRPDLPKFSTSTPQKIAPAPTHAASTWQSIKDVTADAAAAFSDYLKTWVPYSDKVVSAMSWQTTRWKVVLALFVGGVVYALMAERSIFAAMKRLVGGVAVIFGVTAICMLVAAALPKPMAQHDLWYPRYVAVAWPAFAIVVGVLLARLPHKSIRWAAVSLLVTVNLAMHATRLFAGTEPPVDRMVADQLAAAASDSHVKFFYDGPDGGAPPGTATLRSTVGSYYRTVLMGGASISPREFIWGGWQNNLPGGNGGGGRRRGGGVAQFFGGGESISKGNAREANQSDDTQRVVSWDYLAPRRVDQTDALGDALGPQWKRVSDDLFAAREHWTMREFGTYRRREYVRRPVEVRELPVAPVTPPPKPPATPPPAKPATVRPATRPTTTPSTRPASRPATTKPVAKAPPTTAPAVPPATAASPTTTPATAPATQIPATTSPAATRPSDPAVNIPAPPATLPAEPSRPLPATLPSSRPTTVPAGP